MRMRWIGRGIFGFLALILLCVGLLSGFALSTHTCINCVPSQTLCPYAVTLREGLQQFARIIAAGFGVLTLLLFWQAAIGQYFEKWNVPSLVLLKARMNN